MLNIKSTIAIGLSLILSATSVVPATAALVYDRNTGGWVEESVLAPSPRRGSAIRKEIVEYKTSHKPGCTSCSRVARP